jgi:hypothetical protein
MVHFVSDRRLRWDENRLGGIRFVPGILIRFHGGFYSSKVIAKLQNSLVLSGGYRCYENHKSSCCYVFVCGAGSGCELYAFRVFAWAGKEPVGKFKETLWD